MTAYAPLPTDPTAVIGRRISAWLIDLAIFLALAAAVLVATGGVTFEAVTLDTTAEATAFCEAYQDESSQRFCSSSGTEAVYMHIKGTTNGVWVVHFLTYVIIQGLAGGSLGKLALGLRVVDETGAQAGLLKSFIRTLLWIGDAITCGLPIVGGVMIVSTKGHRRLGDLAAGTYVVAKHDVGKPIVVGAPGAVAAPYASWPGQPGFPGQPGMPGQPGLPGQPGQPGTWGAPQDPAPGWGAPPAAQPQEPVTPATDGPIWDDARNTYIQYDRSSSQWVQWDATRSEWRPIDQ